MSPLHLSQPCERTDLDRNTKEIALHSVGDELRVTRDSLGSLHHIEAAELGHCSDIAAAANYTRIAGNVERSIVGCRQGGLHLLEGEHQALQVLGVGIGNEIEVLRRADEAVCSNRDGADHDKADLSLVQRLEQRPEIELGQRGRAAPLIALICLQRVWTRARRSLIEARRSASSLIARARSRSLTSPVSAFIATRSSLAALLTLICLSAPAQALYDPLAGGTTKLTLEKSFLSLMKSHGVKVSAKAPAKFRGGVLTLPISGGEMDPTTARGTIEHEGTLVFSSNRHNVVFRAITIKAKKTPLIAKVGGSQLKVAKAKTISSKREGFGEGFSSKGLLLTQKVATRMNKKLGLGRLLKEGTPFGKTTSKTQPSLVSILPQGQASLTPDPAFIAKLKALFVSLNPIFPAEGRGGVFTFPIGLQGAISPDASQGTLKLVGDLEFLQLGGGQIFWHETWLELQGQSFSPEVDLEPTPAFAGKIGRTGVLALGLSQASVTSDPQARTITLQGAPATLTAQSAQEFNGAFAEGREEFRAGEVVGVVGFGAVGQ